MIEALELFCRRVLGEAPEAGQVALAARRAGTDRIDCLRAAVRLCREQPDDPGGAEDDSVPDGDLRTNVAAEMAVANRQLPRAHREALAGRELLGLGYADIAAVLGIEPAAVGPLLARARLGLRAARRGTAPVEVEACPDAERALRVLACRQDREPGPPEDDDWLHAHLAGCASCEMAQGAMLEASGCYRAWPVGAT